RIHYVQAVREHLVERQSRVASGVRVAQRIVRVDSVDFSRLEEEVRADLDRAQARRGVGREERIAGPGRENDDSTLLEMTNRSAADVLLAHFVDANGRHHPGVQPERLER